MRYKINESAQPEGFVLINYATGEPYNAEAVTSGHVEQVSMTRPSNTTQYAIGDAIGDTGGSAIFEFAGVGAPDGEVFIDSFTMKLNITAVPGDMVSGFRAYFFKSSPTAIADNAAFSNNANDIDSFQKWIDFVIPIDLGGFLVSQNSKLGEQVTCSSTGSLFMVLTTLSAFTPASASVYKFEMHTFDI